jgi:hypothetical protein
MISDQITSRFGFGETKDEAPGDVPGGRGRGSSTTQPSQTVPRKGWWTILRLYNPLQSFFDKTWRPSEIQLI